MGVFLPVMNGRPALGQVEVQPNLLLWGIAALALGMFLAGMKAEPKFRAVRKKRRERKVAGLRRRLKEAELGRIRDFEGE
jgi:hypothetical protein